MNGLTYTQQLVVLVLSGGGAAAVFTLAKAYLAIRNDADTREQAAIANLERWRLEADERATTAYAELGLEREVSSYWQRRAGQAEHLLARHGIDVPEPPPAPEEWRGAPPRDPQTPRP